MTAKGRARPVTGFAFLDRPEPSAYPLAFAHRGGAGEAEENTPAAFENSVALGFRYIETDVQHSRDGVPVVFHDATLDRLTEVQGLLCERSWDELRQIRTRGGQHLMRLEDLLSAWPGVRFNVEPKSDGVVEPLAEALRRCDAVERVCVGSFNESRVQRLRSLLGPALCWSPSHGGVFRLWLAGWGLPFQEPPFPVVQVPQRHKGIPVVTPRFMRAAHSRGVHVHVWTVDRREEMKALLDLGVDGLMSDYPTLLRQVLREQNLWSPG